MTDVRLAQAEDMDDFIALIVEIHGEIGKMSLNINKVREVFFSHLNNRGDIIGVVGDVGGKLKAGVILSIGSIWYSDDLIISDKGVFIRPEFRKSNINSDLIKFMKDMSDLLKLELNFALSTDKRRKAKERLFRRSFEEVGMQYIYRPVGEGI